VSSLQELLEAPRIRMMPSKLASESSESSPLLAQDGKIFPPQEREEDEEEEEEINRRADLI
jgi:hypothetical protein